MKSNIGDAIAYYRKMNLLTQEQLAGRLNVSTQAVSKWEQKISSPDIMLLPEIAELFGISIDELFGKIIKTELCLNSLKMSLGMTTVKSELQFITELS